MNAAMAKVIPKDSLKATLLFRADFRSTFVT